jgi:hypothetical protein
MKKPGANDSESATRGKKYSPPKIVEYGKVRALTTGGSGIPAEMASPGEGLPNKHP